jgi:hypothetical protein
MSNEKMNFNYGVDEVEPRPGLWQNFRGQIPAILATALLVSLVAAWMYRRSLDRQEAALAPFREQSDALRAREDENSRQIAATAQLLREAISRHEGELFKTDEEIQKMNGGRINALADAIAQKVAPALPTRQTPEELARLEDEQVDKISSRTAEKLRPALGEISQRQQSVNTNVIADYKDRIQHLDATVLATQAAAQNALKLTREVSSLYLNSFEDQGVLVRVMALPSEIIHDAVHGSIVDSRERAKVERDLDRKMHEIEQRLNEVQAQGTGGPVATN